MTMRRWSRVVHLQSKFSHNRPNPPPPRLKKRRPPPRGGGAAAAAQPHPIPTSDPSSLFSQIAEIITGNKPPFSSFTQALQGASMADDPHHHYLCRPPPPDSSSLAHSVQRIKNIVMAAADTSIPMEEQLDASDDISFHPLIVEKALQSCSEVAPPSAARLSKWLTNSAFQHTTVTYNTMLRILSEANEFESAETLLNQMLKLSHPVTAWTVLIHHYGKARLPEKMLSLFQRMREYRHPPPDSAAYNTIIRFLCLSNKTRTAMGFYSEMKSKGFSMEKSIYSILMTGLAACGDMDAILMVREDMQEVSGDAESNSCMVGRVIGDGGSLGGENIEHVVTGLCGCGLLSDAMELVNIMKKKGVVDGKINSVVIEGFLKENSLSKALHLFHSTVIDDPKYTPPPSLYNSLMQRLFDQDEYQRGHELHQEMLARGIEPDNSAFTSFVASHFRHHNSMSEALNSITAMAELGGLLPPLKSPSCYYSHVIKTLCNSSTTERLMKLLQRISTHKSKTHIPPPPPSETKASEKTAASPRLNSCRKEDVLNVWKVLSSRKKWGAVEEALINLNLHYTPSLIQTVLRRCRPGEGGAAVRFFTWARKKTTSITAESYNLAIKIAGRGKNFKQMRELFSEMGREKAVERSRETWSILIMQYGRAGELEKAIDTMKEMKSRGVEPGRSCFKCIITCICEKKGGIKQAQRFFKEMIEQGFFPNRRLVSIYMQYLCNSGKLKKAEEMVAELKRVGYTEAVAKSMYIRGMCKAGRVEEVMMMKEEGGMLGDYVKGSVVDALVKKGRVEEAMEEMRRGGGWGRGGGAGVDFVDGLFFQKRGGGEGDGGVGGDGREEDGGDICGVGEGVGDEWESEGGVGGVGEDEEGRA